MKTTEQQLTDAGLLISDMIGTNTALLPYCEDTITREQLYNSTCKAIANHPTLSDAERVVWMQETTERYVKSCRKFQLIVNADQLPTS